MIVYYDSNMKVRTSITLSEQVLAAADAYAAAHGGSRSSLIEDALAQFLSSHARETRDQRDADIINTHSRRLNAEALETLDYQDRGR